MTQAVDIDMYCPYCTHALVPLFDDDIIIVDELGELELKPSHEYSCSCESWIVESLYEARANGLRDAKGNLI